MGCQFDALTHSTRVDKTSFPPLPSLLQVRFIPQRNLFNFLGSTLIYLGRGKAKGKSEKFEAPIADSNAGASLLLRAHKSSSQDDDVALNKGSQGARA